MTIDTHNDFADVPRLSPFGYAPTVEHVCPVCCADMKFYGCVTCNGMGRVYWPFTHEYSRCYLCNGIGGEWRCAKGPHETS